MKFEGVYSKNGKANKALLRPVARNATVAGMVVENHGAGLRHEQGVAILMSMSPQDLAELAEDPSLLRYHFRQRREGNNLLNTSIAPYASAEIVRGYDDSGEPIIGGRLKEPHFAETPPPRRLQLAAFPGVLKKILN